MNVIFSGVGAVVGTAASGIRTVAYTVQPVFGGIFRTAFSTLGGLGRGASSMTYGLYRTVKTTGTQATRVIQTANGYVIKPVTTNVGNAARGAAAGVKKAGATTATIVSLSYKLYAAIQSILVLLFMYLIVNNISKILDLFIWCFTPVAEFMAFLDSGLEWLRDGLGKKVDPSLSKRNPNPMDYVIALGAFVMDFCLVVIQEFFILVSVIFQTFLIFVQRLARRSLFWLVFGLGLFISAAIEHNYIDIATTTNSLVVNVESFTRTAFRVGNVGFDIYDTLAPMQNVAFIYTVGRIRELCHAFCPEPFKLTPEGRRLLGETEESTIQRFENRREEEPLRERRRLIDTNTMRSKIKMLKTAVNKIAFGTYILNLIDLRITALYLILAKPLMEALSTLSSPIERLVSKIYCMMIGGFFCSFAEIFYFVSVIVVDFINSHTIFNIPYPSDFACKKEQLKDIDPEQCGNWMDAAKPPGSFFSALIPNGAQPIGERPRSLGAVYNESSSSFDDTGEDYPLLECKQHPYDNTWVETLDGKVIHTSQYNKCPLSRHVFGGDEFSNVKQFNMMGIDTECYVVCLHSVKYESCHNQYTGHIRRLLGSCDPTVVKIENEQQARRRLNSLFPDTYFGWSELFGGGEKKKTTPSPLFSPLPYGPHTFEGKATTANAEDLVKTLRTSLKDNPRFTVFGIECQIKWEPTVERIYTNMLCIGLRMIRDYTPEIDNLLFTREGRGRQLFTEEKKEGSFKKWSATVKGSKDALVDTVSMVRSYVRLLHSTDPDKPIETRIDEMIDVANYQSRRHLTTDTSSNQRIQGFEEPIIKDIGWCQGENMYPCPGKNGPCVPTADRDQCPPLEEDASILDTVGYYLNLASTVTIDPEAILQDMSQCYKQYDIDMDTVPVTLTNLEQEGGGGSFCIGMRPPFPYRFPEVEVKGINRFVSSGCVVDEVNVCTCDFYYRPLLNYDVLTFYYTDADLQIKLINFFTWWHHLAYFIIWIRVPWWQDIWYMFISWLIGGPERLPLWVLYFFGDWGIRASPERQWYCWGLHTNSALTIIAIIVLSYDLIKSLDVVSYWFWSLVRRITFYHHPLFWPKATKSL